MQAKACVMLPEWTSDFESVTALKESACYENLGMGMGYSFLKRNSGLDGVVVEKGIMQDACTSQITAI